MKATLFIISISLSALGMFCGLIETISNKDHGKTGCTYESIISFNPGRVITCELFRKRFEFP